MTQKQGRNAYRRELVAELNSVFPPTSFRALPRHGNEGWTPQMVVWVSVVMFWIAGNTLEEQFSAARKIVRFLKPHWKMPRSYSGFTAAQIRCWSLMGPVLMGPVLMSRMRPDVAACRPCRVRGWMVLAVDGSRFECPRSTANEQGLGCAGREKTQPQIFYTHLQHVGTGLPWDFRMGPGTDSERRHMDEMLHGLPPHTLLTADAGFISHHLVTQLIDANQFFVLRIGGNKTLITNLEGDSSDDSIVYLWPQNLQSEQPVKLRHICFLSTAGLPVVLVTNVLNPEVLSDDDACEIYKSRWGIEVYFRHLKQTMSFTCLRSRTPATALNEHRWRLISFGAMHRMAVCSQLAVGLNPRRFSAAKARREIREVLHLMQLGQRGPSIADRWATVQIDSYERKGPKTTRPWPRKKNDKPPKPPVIRNAKPTEVTKAKRLGIKALLIS